MKIIIVGAEGTVGRAVAAELGKRHEVIAVGRKSGLIRADITDRASVEALFARTGKVDAVVATAGHTHFAPLTAMTEDQFRVGLDDKVMGQVRMVLSGLPFVNDGGSFTLTSGILSRDPIRQGASAATVDAAIEGFVLAAAIEMPRGIRINAVCPGLLEESAKAYEGFFPGHVPVPGWKVAQGYAKSVEGAITGQTIVVL